MKARITFKRILIGIVVVICLSIGLSVGFPLLTQDTCMFTVSDKERIMDGVGDAATAKYLVFTDKETFENTDCFIWFKFNSSDLQGKLERGKKYKAKVYGWRIPFLSVYRNIVKAKEIR